MRLVADVTNIPTQLQPIAHPPSFPFTPQHRPIYALLPPFVMTSLMFFVYLRLKGMLTHPNRNFQDKGL
jgi:hypothetical protein